MERSLTSSQMTGLVESLHKHKFDPSITSEICAFVRQRCAANWATATPSTTPAPAPAAARPSTPSANERNRAGDVVELARAVGLKGFETERSEHPTSGRFQDITSADSVDDILALAKDMGLNIRRRSTRG